MNYFKKRAYLAVSSVLQAASMLELPVEESASTVRSTEPVFRAEEFQHPWTYGSGLSTPGSIATISC